MNSSYNAQMRKTESTVLPRLTNVRDYWRAISSVIRLVFCVTRYLLDATWKGARHAAGRWLGREEWKKNALWCSHNSKTQGKLLKINYCLFLETFSRNKNFLLRLEGILLAEIYVQFYYYACKLSRNVANNFGKSFTHKSWLVGGWLALSRLACREDANVYN